jgi:SNF2 family DNA or RNA helicase
MQSDAVNELAPLDRTGLYLEPGLGKTAVSTFCALYKLIMGQAETVLAIMPPLLVDQWAAWLSKIKRKEGKQPTIHKYAGPPAKRKEIGFKTDFMLSGVQLFKQDIERFNDELGGKNIHVILDEAQCIKNVDSNNYQGL